MEMYFFLFNFMTSSLAETIIPCPSIPLQDSYEAPSILISLLYLG